MTQKLVWKVAPPPTGKFETRAWPEANLEDGSPAFYLRCADEYVPANAKTGNHGPERGWEDEDGVTFDDVTEAVEWLRAQGPLEASSSEFGDRIWYTGPVIQDRAYFERGEERTLSFFLRDATEDEERAVFDAIVKGIDPEEAPGFRM